MSRFCTLPLSARWTKGGTWIKKFKADENDWIEKKEEKKTTREAPRRALEPWSGSFPAELTAERSSRAWLQARLLERTSVENDTFPGAQTRSARRSSWNLEGWALLTSAR